jgi:transposase
MAANGEIPMTVDNTRTGQLLDVVPGRDSAAPAAWLAEQDPGWLGRIRYEVMNLSGPYRATFDTMLPYLADVRRP